MLQIMSDGASLKTLSSRTTVRDGQEIQNKFKAFAASLDKHVAANSP